MVSDTSSRKGVLLRSCLGRTGAVSPQVRQVMDADIGGPSGEGSMADLFVRSLITLMQLLRLHGAFLRAMYHLIRHNPVLLRDVIELIPEEVTFNAKVPKGWESATFGTPSRTPSVLPARKSPIRKPEDRSGEAKDAEKTERKRRRKEKREKKERKRAASETEGRARKSAKRSEPERPASKAPEITGKVAVKSGAPVAVRNLQGTPITPNVATAKAADLAKAKAVVVPKKPEPPKGPPPKASGGSGASTMGIGPTQVRFSQTKGGLATLGLWDAKAVPKQHHVAAVRHRVMTTSNR